MCLRSLMKIFAVVLAALVTGCAPATNTNDSRNKALEGHTGVLRSVSLGALDSGNESNWRCPSDYNVTLRDGANSNGYDYSGNGNFKVCVARDDTSRFKILGSTSAQALCFYPMLASYGSDVQLANEAPQCFTVTGQSIEVDFSAFNINYMVIVDSNYTNALNECLSGPTGCPARSEGFVQ